MLFKVFIVSTISLCTHAVEIDDSSLAVAAKSSRRYCSSTKSVGEIKPRLVACTENMSAEECKMFHYTNAVRISCDLKPFVGSKKCVEAARDHTREMAELKYFDHRSPNGVRPMNRMQKRGIAANLYAENIAWDPNGRSLDIIEGWMNSSGHRRNILDPNITHLGIGASMGRFRGTRGRFWNQCFHAGNGTGSFNTASHTNSVSRSPTHDGSSLLPILAIAGIATGVVLKMNSSRSIKPTASQRGQFPQVLKPQTVTQPGLR